MLATDPLSLVFIGCFLFGMFFLVAAALLGQFHHGGLTHDMGHGGIHHIDIGGHGAHHGHIATGAQHHHGGTHAQGNSFSIFDVLNPTSIVLFLLGFGFFGYVFNNTTRLALPITLVLAAFGGIIITALLVLLLNRAFGNSEGSTIQDVADRTGLLGKVSLTIPENSLGEVIYVSPGGMRKSIPARSLTGRRLERDQEVVVVNYSHGVAEVDTWDHFVNQDEASISQSASSVGDLETLRALLEDSDNNDTHYALRKDGPKE